MRPHLIMQCTHAVTFAQNIWSVSVFSHCEEGICTLTRHPHQDILSSRHTIPHAGGSSSSPLAGVRLWNPKGL